jgi:hypothetical protein
MGNGLEYLKSLIKKGEDFEILDRDIIQDIGSSLRSEFDYESNRSPIHRLFKERYLDVHGFQFNAMAYLLYHLNPLEQDENMLVQYGSTSDNPYSIKILFRKLSTEV